MLGRTPGYIKPVRPLRDGVIADFDAAEKMLVHFVRKAMGRGRWRRPRLVIGVPSEITQVERRAVRDSGFRVKASEVHLVEEPMAAAIGAGLPVTDAAGNMIIDIGGGTTDIAVISMAGSVYGRSLRVAGDAMDEAIISYVKKTFNLYIGERTAQQIKFEIGSAMPLDDTLEMQVKGRHVMEGVPKTITVTDEDIRSALADPLNQIVRAVREALEKIPPELCADIYDRGIVLTGGGALLRNLDHRLRDDIGLPVLVAENPLTSVVLGAGMMLSDMELLRRVAAQ
jgi:rod shape-determining protein MreB